MPSAETTTTEHEEDVYERHHYEYTVPEIKTIEATTNYHGNEEFHIETDVKESNRRRQQFKDKVTDRKKWPEVFLKSLLFQ